MSSLEPQKHHSIPISYVTVVSFSWFSIIICLLSLMMQVKILFMPRKAAFCLGEFLRVPAVCLDFTPTSIRASENDAEVKHPVTLQTQVQFLLTPDLSLKLGDWKCSVYR